jgi:hypothetical protein
MNVIRSLLPTAAVAVVLPCVTAGEPRDSGDAPKVHSFAKLAGAQTKPLNGNRIKLRPLIEQIRKYKELKRLESAYEI